MNIRKIFFGSKPKEGSKPNTIEIEIPEGKKVEWVDGVLTLTKCDPNDVKGRIKTFKDACRELGNKHPFVIQYESFRKTCDNNSKDVLAYLKLRIIVRALNGGWKPDYTKKDHGCYPWFRLYCKKEIEHMPHVVENCIFLHSHWYSDWYACMEHSFSSISSSATEYCYNSHLILKTNDLAKYAGEQFIDIWADYFLGRAYED